MFSGGLFLQSELHSTRDNPIENYSKSSGTVTMEAIKVPLLLLMKVFQKVRIPTLCRFILYTDGKSEKFYNGNFLQYSSKLSRFYYSEINDLLKRGPIREVL